MNISPQELNRIIAKLIELNKEFNFANQICQDLALKQLSSYHSPGLLYAVKDMFSVKNTITSASSKILENYQAVYDATVIEKLNAKENILLAKLNQDEFAQGGSNEYSARGKVLNPVDKNRIPGGSSGGSASIVALDLVDFALGTDTGGSVRNPASFTGTIGFKPTYGAISRYGVLAMASSFDTIGIISKKIEIIAKVFHQIRGVDKHDLTSINIDEVSGPKKMKVAVVKQFIKNLDPAILQKIEFCLEKLQELGYAIDYIELSSLDYALACYYILVPAEVSSNMARYDNLVYGNPHSLDSVMSTSLDDWYLKQRELFGDEVKRRIGAGNFILSSGYYDAYYLQASRLRRYIADQFNSAFAKYDFLIGPTTPNGATEFGNSQEDPTKLYLADIMTVAANIAGLPAISLPLLEDQLGLPVGLQLMTEQKQDLYLLELASQLMEQSHG